MNVLLDAYMRTGDAGGASSPVRSWPSDYYRDDPVRFAIEQLGVAPTADQAKVMKAIATGADLQNAVKAGRRSGKSSLIALLDAWAFCSFPEATVFNGAPCLRQITEIVYHELTGILTDQRCLKCRILHPERVGKCCPHVTPIDCSIGASPVHGVRSADGRRRIFGAAPRDAQSARGIAAQGSGMFCFLDEMSGIPSDTYEVLFSNCRASGGRFAAFGNPAKLHDAFWQMFHSGSWGRHTMSVLNVINVILRQRIVDGLADHEWHDEMLAAHGPKDIRYIVDCLGDFPTRAMLELISDVDLSGAFARFETFESMNTPPTGDIWLGIDPAGGTGNDDSVIYARRGTVVFHCDAFQGGTDEIINRVLTLIPKIRNHPTERVDINFDASSRMGSDLDAALRAEAVKDSNIAWHGLYSRGAYIEKNTVLYGSGYARPRDAYWGNMCLRLAKNIALRFDQELRQELLTGEWNPRDDNLKRLIDKRVHAKKLGGRSPDRGDALSYCLFEHRLETLSETTAEALEAWRNAPPPAVNLDTWMARFAASMQGRTQRITERR